MDARERWQALQARLTAARAAVDAGDRATALAEITAALELDGEFLAAHALRDRIIEMNAARSDGAPSHPAPSHLAPQGLPPGYAKFEQRAKRRRVDRRLDAARAAIQQQRLKAAASALDEVIELDPNLPELAELTAQFDELRRATATPHRGPWIAAAAVFAIAMFGASWLQDSAPILTRQIVAAAPLPPPPAPSITVTERLTAVGTAGVRDTDVAARTPAVEAPRMPEAAATLSPASLKLPAVPIDNPPPARVTEAGVVAPEAVPIAPVSATIAPAPPAISSRVDAPDDDVLVKQVLHRYRTAYEGLDARSAQAVWPGVNEAALARAFDGLESQSLTFDACDVRLHGEAATATCHGSARYVMKVGSRDPRVEPRVWNFTLHKAGSDWTIDSARAER
jgi:hypothetical protein